MTNKRVFFSGTPTRACVRVEHINTRSNDWLVVVLLMLGAGVCFDDLAGGKFGRWKINWNLKVWRTAVFVLQNWNLLIPAYEFERMLHRTPTVVRRRVPKARLQHLHLRQQHSTTTTNNTLYSEVLDVLSRRCPVVGRIFTPVLMVSKLYTSNFYYRSNNSETWIRAKPLYVPGV